MSTTLYVTICVLLAIFSSSTARQLPRDANAPARYDLDPDRLPENVAVAENSEVILRCAVHSLEGIHGIQWWEYVYHPLGAPISNNLGIGEHPQRDRYQIIQRDDREYSLRIFPVLMNDAGLYQCLDTWGNPVNKQRHSLQLTVVAQSLNCTTTLPSHGMVLVGQYHTNECTLRYQGGITPNMSWSGIQPFDQAYVATPTHIWSGMQVSITRDMDTRFHSCDMYFTDHFLPVDEDTAANIPALTYNHRERQMFVYWAPTNLEANPMKDYYEVNDVITCSCEAYPEADFTWFNLRTGQIIPGPEIEVTADWLGFDQTLRCEARNEVLENIYSANIFIEVSVPIPTTTTPVPTTPTTTLPPAVARCTDLTGGWVATYPGRASLCISLDLERNGYLTGLARNESDSWWVDVVGRAHSEDFDQVSFSGIQPLDFGVTSFIGECHRCFGVERILAHVTTRQRGLACGTAGSVRHTEQYEFYRSPTLYCPNLPAQTK